MSYTILQISRHLGFFLSYFLQYIQEPFGWLAKGVCSLIETLGSKNAIWLEKGFI